MANQRQFRVDDTSIWPYRFGSAIDGAKTFSASKALDASDKATYNTFTGTLGALTGALGSAWTWTGPVLIYQTQGTGAGQWELNYIDNSSPSATATLLLALQNTYVPGAQIITCGQFSSLTINNGVTISAPSWNGSSAGAVFLMCNGVTNIAGSLSASGLGFRGGQGSPPTGNNMGYTGEGYGGISIYNQSSAEFNAGGGGQGGNPSGGGGSYSTPGTSGANVGGTGGQPGNIDSNTSAYQQLQTIWLGGGGGSGANTTGSGISGAGGPGGGLILLISKLINITGGVLSNGANGNNSGGGDGPTDANGGAGSGGPILLKGQQVVLGTSLVTAAGGIGGGTNNFGGDGGEGRIHIDSLSTPTGITNPTMDTRIDTILADPAYASIF